MWRLLKNLVFSIDEPEGLTVAEEQEVIDFFENPETEDVLIKECDDFENENRVGVVTHLSLDVGVIDGIYYFNISDFPENVFSVNDKVKFTVYFNDINTIIKNLEKVSENELPVVLNEHSENIGIDSNSNSITTLCGQIFDRRKRTFQVRLDDGRGVIYFNLNNVESKFIPDLGDIVELDVVNLVDQASDNKNKLESLKVVKIRPKKTSLNMGVVTSWDEKYGTISNFALFTLDVCETGFKPGVGCKVCSHLVRSDCINGYKWRATNVIPRNIHVGNSRTEECKRLEEEFRNKRGISINICQKITLKLNQELDFKLELTNKSSHDRVVMIFPKSQEDDLSQVKLLLPSHQKMTIKAGGVLDIPFNIVGKYLGKSYEDFVWDFGEFSIRRRIVFEILSHESIPQVNDEISFVSHFSKQISLKDLTANDEGDVMPGRKKWKSVFVPVKMGNFLVPKKLVEIIFPDGKVTVKEIMIELEKFLPCLKEGLNIHSYQKYMHSLLFMEEVELLKKVALLDIEDASFRKFEDYLILKVPENSFYTNLLSSSDFVLVSLPWNKKKKMQGIIHKITNSEIWLKFATVFHSEYKEGTCYFTSFCLSRSSIRRKHHAIDETVKILGEKFLFPNRVEAKAPLVIFEKQEDWDSIEAEAPNGDDSNDLILSKYFGKGRGRGISFNCAGSGYGKSQKIAEHVPDLGTKKEKEVVWFNSFLNRQQKNAVVRILYGIARPLPYVIFGPPGTGKTVTVVEAILQVYKLIPSSRIIVGTPTNSAADLIAQRLMDSGNLSEGEFLRLVGFNYAEQGRLTSSLVPYAGTPNFLGKNDDSVGYVPAMNRIRIGEHRIVVGTLSTLGSLHNMGFPRGCFTHIFIDEAGQADEPDLLVASLLLSPLTGNIILSGDPLQLGPVVMSRLARSYGLKDSFLVRILGRFPYIKDPLGFVNNCGYDPRLVTKLVNNYRSLDGILQIFNSLFYDGDLVPNVSDETSEEALLLSKLKSFTLNGPVIFHGLRGNPLQERDSKSWFNAQEIFQVFYYLNKLYYDGVHPDQIGIITPYQLQVKKIQNLLESYGLEAPKIGSVEEFQGQERMVMILSLVRSEEEVLDSLDDKFITDFRRVNVAISRARALLIIIGDSLYLDNNKTWHKILKYVVANKSYVGCHFHQRDKS